MFSIKLKPIPLNLDRRKILDSIAHYLDGGQPIASEGSPRPVSYFNIRWINPSEFEVSRFRLIESRYSKGYKKVLMVNVKFSAEGLKPVFSANIETKGMLFHLKRLGEFTVGSGVFVVVLCFWGAEGSFNIRAVIWGIVICLGWVLSIHRFFEDSSETEIFLHQLATRDDM